jgi:hypothetical protein
MSSGLWVHLEGAHAVTAARRGLVCPTKLSRQANFRAGPRQRGTGDYTKLRKSPAKIGDSRLRRRELREAKGQRGESCVPAGALPRLCRKEATHRPTPARDLDRPVELRTGLDVLIGRLIYIFADDPPSAGVLMPRLSTGRLLRA